MRTLRIAAAAEAVTLVALLVNLLTAHVPAVTSLLGPSHGTAYLVVVAATWLFRPELPRAARWRALVPGAGGLLVVRGVRTRGGPAA